MLSKFVEIGGKVELLALDRELTEKPGEEARRGYISRVCDILSEDTMEIAMPMEQGHLILLPVDSEYSLVFYGKTCLYQCLGRVVDRYKSNNQYILVVELISNLRKYQRREYFRFGCSLEIHTRALSEEEIRELEDTSDYMPQEKGALKQGVIVDISGGGLRFLSQQRYEPDSYLYCCYHLLQGSSRKKYEMLVRVLTVKEVENRLGLYEHRVQYHNVDNDTREEIIKFIFAEERKSRKKGNDL